MSRSLRLAALIGIVGLTSWFSTPGLAYAILDCESVDAQYCSPWSGDHLTTCWSESTQRVATCLCDGTATWFCKM